VSIENAWNSFAGCLNLRWPTGKLFFWWAAVTNYCRGEPVAFEIAHFSVTVGSRLKNGGIYPNPKRERGILGKNCPNAKSQSLTYVSGCDVGKLATSKPVARGGECHSRAGGNPVLRSGFPPARE
jgi:hypothetical protein